jgi:hypothetical protein
MNGYRRIFRSQRLDKSVYDTPICIHFEEFLPIKQGEYEYMYILILYVRKAGERIFVTTNYILLQYP